MCPEYCSIPQKSPNQLPGVFCQWWPIRCYVCHRDGHISNRKFNNHYRNKSQTKKILACHRSIFLISMSHPSPSPPGRRIVTPQSCCPMAAHQIRKIQYAVSFVCMMRLREVECCKHYGARTWLSRNAISATS